MVQDRAILTVADCQEAYVICWMVPLLVTLNTLLSRTCRYSALNISETVQDRDIVVTHY